MKKALLLLLTPIILLAEKKELASKEELYTGKQYKNAFANPADTDLPNVLIIGDSISIGYTTKVRKDLKGIADVFRIPTNGRYAKFGNSNLPKWLKGRKWDVIHFNWGLWDLCYRNPKSKNQGSRDKVDGKLTATLDQYKTEMTAIIKQLKATKAKLIWCETTPVPEHEAGRIVGDALKYNKVANEIMKANKVQINQLHAYALKKQKEIQKKKGDVHFTKKGYDYLGAKVAQEIKAQLK